MSSGARRTATSISSVTTTISAGDSRTVQRGAAQSVFSIAQE